MGKRVIKSYRTVDTENPKFEKYNGLPKFSYSAYTSWTEDQYRGAFIADKILGVPDPGNVFTDFGSACGEYLETRDSEDKKVSEYLKPSDIEVLDRVVLPPNSEFEREIMLKRSIDKRGDYCIHGFIDRATETPEAKVDVIDYKTGGANKSSKYGGPDYNQTRLYSYALEKEEGEEIGYVGVELLHRKGKSLVPGEAHPIRLEGTIEAIETPYDSKSTETFLQKFDKVVIEISDCISFYEKYFID